MLVSWLLKTILNCTSHESQFILEAHFHNEPLQILVFTTYKHSHVLKRMTWDSGDLNWDFRHIPRAETSQNCSSHRHAIMKRQWICNRLLDRYGRITYCFKMWQKTVWKFRVLSDSIWIKYHTREMWSLKNLEAALWIRTF